MIRIVKYKRSSLQSDPHIPLLKFRIMPEAKNMHPIDTNDYNVALYIQATYVNTFTITTVFE